MQNGAYWASNNLFQLGFDGNGDPIKWCYLKKKKLKKSGILICFRLENKERQVLTKEISGNFFITQNCR